MACSDDNCLSGDRPHIRKISTHFLLSPQYRNWRKISLERHRWQKRWQWLKPVPYSIQSFIFRFTLKRPCCFALCYHSTGVIRGTEWILVAGFMGVCEQLWPWHLYKAMAGWCLQVSPHPAVTRHGLTLGTIFLLSKVTHLSLIFVEAFWFQWQKSSNFCCRNLLYVPNQPVNVAKIVSFL